MSQENSHNFEQLPKRSPLRDVINNTLRGFRVKKEVKPTELPSEEDTPSTEFAGLINPAEQLKTINDSFPELTAEEIRVALEAAGLSTGTTANAERPHNRLNPTQRRLVQAMSSLMIAGIMPLIPQESYAATDIPTVTPTPSVTSTRERTAVPTPTATPKPTETPEATATPEVIQVNYAVIKNDDTNIREDATTESRVVIKGLAGEKFKLTGETEEDADGYTWHQVVIIESNIQEEMVYGWVREDVIEPEFVSEPQILPSTGIGGGGVLEEPIITPTETMTNSNLINSTEISTGEITKAQEDMNRWLPENFREFYENQGGSVNWNNKLNFYEVTFTHNGTEISYILFPQTGAKIDEQDDLEHGLYYLGEKATIETKKIVNGKQITQTIHFLVSPGFPETKDDTLWDGSFNATGSEAVINMRTALDSTIIAESLSKTFGFKEDESFQLFILYSNQDKTEVDKTEKPRQQTALVSGGNDYWVRALDFSSQDMLATYAVAYYPEIEPIAERMLLNEERPESALRFGHQVIDTSLERIAESSPWRDRQEMKELMNGDVWESFITENLYNTIYAIEDELTAQNNGRYTPVFDIKIDPNIIKEYQDTLRTK